MRQRLPNRRASTSFNFVCGKHSFTATYSCFPGSNQIAEIFLGNWKSGSDVDAAAEGFGDLSIALFASGGPAANN